VTIRDFEWDDDNLDHIAEHELTPDEVESCARGLPKIRRSRDGRYVALGHTAEGRYLLVVFVYQGGGRVRVITTRDMKLSERRLYRRK
jgi:uncharacterized DUF497 family protein